MNRAIVADNKGERGCDEASGWVMRRLLTTLVILTGLFCSAGAVWADAQSANDKGDKAYYAGDYAEAVKWFRKAAEQGYAVAQNSFIYLTG